MKARLEKVGPRELAAAFRALGEPTRLRIFDFLRNCCCSVALDKDGSVRPVDGKTVGEVCCSISGSAKITSTLSHHLKELRLAGLITMERRGKHIVCAANPKMLRAVSAFLERCETEVKK
jgi:ArsR family transcriptional regulator